MKTFLTSLTLLLLAFTINVHAGLGTGIAKSAGKALTKSSKLTTGAESIDGAASITKQSTEIPKDFEPIYNRNTSSGTNLENIKNQKLTDEEIYWGLFNLGSKGTTQLRAHCSQTQSDETKKLCSRNNQK
jgi:hypothetical protein